MKTEKDPVNTRSKRERIFYVFSQVLFIIALLCLAIPNGCASLIKTGTGKTIANVIQKFSEDNLIIFTWIALVCLAGYFFLRLHLHQWQYDETKDNLTSIEERIKSLEKEMRDNEHQIVNAQAEAVYKTFQLENQALTKIMKTHEQIGIANAKQEGERKNMLHSFRRILKELYGCVLSSQADVSAEICRLSDDLRHL